MVYDWRWGNRDKDIEPDENVFIDSEQDSESQQERR